MADRTPTQSKHTVISIAKQARVITLQAGYVADGQGSYGCINAYSEEGAAKKEDFLRDGLAYLRAIGYALAVCGFTEMKVSMNRAGIAVSGEVTAEYWHPQLTVWLYVQLSSPCLRLSCQEQREDGLALVARTREQRENRVVEGGNCWFAPSQDSVQMAHALLPIVGLQVPAPSMALPSDSGRDSAAQQPPPFASLPRAFGSETSSEQQLPAVCSLIV